jgi:hypothetical protein
MTQDSEEYYEDTTNWTRITLFGDRDVGKLSIPRRYIHGDPPIGPGGVIYSQRNYTLTSLPLNSSPLLESDRNKVHARVPATTGDHDPEMVEMMIHFYKVYDFEFEPSNARHMERLFAPTNVIALCYDCSRPETLHNAIYKVCLYSQPPHYYCHPSQLRS